MRKTIVTAAAIAAFGLAGATSTQAAPISAHLFDGLAAAGNATPVYQPWPNDLPGPSPLPDDLWGWTCPATADLQTCQDFWFTFDY